MIFIVATIVLLAASIFGAWYACKRDSESLCFVSASFIFALSIVLPIEAVSSIVAYCSLSQNEECLQVSCEVDKLVEKENTLYMTLAGDLGLTVTDSSSVYHVIVDKPIEMKSSIDEYNSGVLDLKQNLFDKKLRLESPWTSWFINPGFTKVDHYNANATNYRDILGDSLKTFELTIH